MPKLLWMSPYSLHDDYSSAAINCKLLLESLANLDWEVCACTSFILEDDSSEDTFASLKNTIGPSTNQVLELEDNKVHYVYIKSHTHQEEQLTLHEMQVFFDTFCEITDNWRPDFVLGFGTSMLFQTCMAEAQRRGIWTLYMLLNGNHAGYRFPNIDIILTNSQANARLYYERDRINAIPIGEAFGMSHRLTTPRNPQYITFVNPALELGLSFFAKLAHTCQKLYPEQRFLVVSYHGNFAQNLRLLQDDSSTQLPNSSVSLQPHGSEHMLHPFDVTDFPNVDLASRASKLKTVYAVTRAFVMPTLWWEAWGRIATESILNDIPVVASTSGGLAESTGGAGIHIPIPEKYRKNYLAIPSDQDIQPWIDGLHRALNEDLSERMAQAKLNFALNRTLDRIQNLLLPLQAQQRRSKIAYAFPERWSRFYKTTKQLF